MIVRRLNELPDYENVLAENGKCKLVSSSHLTGKVAVITHAKGDASIVAVDGALMHNDYRRIYAELNAQGYNNIESIPSNDELVAILNQSSSQAQEVQSESAYAELFDEIVVEAICNNATDLRIKLFKDKQTAEVYNTIYGDETHVRTIKYSTAIDMVRANFNGSTNATDQNVAVFNEEKTNEWIYAKNYLKATFNKLGQDCAVKLRMIVKPAFKQLILSTRLQVAKTGKGPLKLDELGLTERHIEILKSVAVKPKGLVLICGIPGQGKNTTGNALLVFRKSVYPKRNIMTLEAPVEVELKSIEQVSLKGEGEELDKQFAAGIRDFMRMRSDAIMVGETRDKETARAMQQAVNTGHYVQTTLHTDSHEQAISRLKDLGVAADEMVAQKSINAIITQRLVQRLCDNCKIPATNSSSIRGTHIQCAIASLDIQVDKFYEKGAGCLKCKSLGVVGVVPITEIALPVRVEEGGFAMKVSLSRAIHGAELAGAGVIGLSDYLLSGGMV